MPARQGLDPEVVVGLPIPYVEFMKGVFCFLRHGYQSDRLIDIYHSYIAKLQHLPLHRQLDIERSG